MSHENGKGQPFGGDKNIHINVLTAELDKVKEEHKAMEKKLREAEKKAQKDLGEFLMTSRQKEEVLANVIAILKEEHSYADGQRRIPLPLELNCQIFECLKFGIQRKFIGGLGRGIYGMFRQKVMTKSKRLQNPQKNGWKESNTDAIISSNGLLASYNTGSWPNVLAKKGFPISGKLSRTDNFPGTILYYFEVTTMSSYRIILVGLSSGNFPNGRCVGDTQNSYAISYGRDYCWLSGDYYPFEWPSGAIKPTWNRQGDVVGCGLLLNPDGVSLFFTVNGILMGKQIPINPTVNLLYPAITLYGGLSVEANFGEDLAKPFKYDTQKWPGLIFKWKRTHEKYSIFHEINC